MPCREAGMKRVDGINRIDGGQEKGRHTVFIIFAFARI